MDDAVVCADTGSKLEERLRAVFERFKERGLELNKDKCSFRLAKPDPRKVEAVCGEPKAQNVEIVSGYIWISNDIYS